MTSLLAPSATGTVPAVEAVARVHAVLDEVAETEVGEGGHNVAEVSGHDVAEVERAIARMEALKLRLVASAHRQGAAGRCGMSGTPAWLAAHTRAWGGKAAADVALATALHDSLPVTRRALATGALSTAHAAVIAETTRRLPAVLSDGERVRVESALVARARHVDPARLRRAAKRALLAAERSAEEALVHEDGELRGEEARAAARVRLTLHDNLDGTVTGHFTVPTLAGAILRKAIQQMVSPRRRREVDEHARPREVGEHGSPREVGEHARRGGVGEHARRGAVGEHARPRDDWAADQGAAFVELLEHLPTDRLHGKVAATVVVTVQHEHLREALGAARLDTGHDISAGEARRLACSAGILPAVLDGTSLPLDLGRTRRFFTEAQRVAMATTYDECAAQGCDRPYAWCDLHHQDPWSSGGATDLALAVPLCGFHHRLAHDPRHGHEVHTGADGRKVVSFGLRGG